MKIKLTVLFAFFLQSLLYIPHAHSYCAVYRETDATNSRGESTEGSNFRSAVASINSTRSTNSSTANECQIPTKDPDYKAGAFDLIWFGTEHFVADDSEAVSKVTLTAKNLEITPYRNVKIGNSSKDMLADDGGSFANSDYTKSDYENDYENVYPKIPLPQNDVVTIDGRAANLKCKGVDNGDGGLKGYVYLSDVVVLAAAGEVMNEGCWRNAGNAFLCDGTLKDSNEDLSQYDDPHGKDYTKWCNSDTVTEEGGGKVFPWEYAECAERETRWQDRDRDGFGDPNLEALICVKWINSETGEEILSPFFGFSSMGIGKRLFPAGIISYVDNDLDCNDEVAEINPDAFELCDNIDNNCNSEIDETFATLGENCTNGVGECLASSVWQCSEDGTELECGAVAGEATAEICNDLDDDCDGATDEDEVCGDGGTTTPKETLCDDLDTEGNPIDNDGDGAANCLDSDCASTIECNPVDPADDCSLDEDGAANCYDPNCWTEFDCALIVPIDQDGDGVSIENGDCNDDPIDDTAKLILPSADEICDSVDNNCNDEIDENDVCVNPNESDDSGSSGGCGCYLGNQKPNELQQLFSALLAFGLFCPLVLLRRIAKRSTASQK